MKYDDASWHYGGEFPDSSPQEYGATHIALIMKWCFIKGWAGEIHLEDERTNEDLKKVISGDLSATKFFMTWCDGKLTDEDFNEEGNQFLQSYYGKETDIYTPDYAEQFGDYMYVRPEEEHNFNEFSAMVQKRYIELTKSERPWWKFW